MKPHLEAVLGLTREIGQAKGYLNHALPFVCLAAVALAAVLIDDTVALRVRAGRQVLRLLLTRAALRDAVLHVTVAVRATTAVRASAAQTSLQVR